MNETLDETWTDFCSNVPYRELLAEFLEGIAHLERYQERHMGQPLHAQHVHAMATMRKIGEQLRDIVNDPARFQEPAPPHVVMQILGMVRKVKRTLPTLHSPGHA